MAGLLELTGHQPSRSLADGEVLIAQGEHGGDLFVLERGKLGIARDGVKLATLTIPGSVVGEISVLTGSNSSATVTAIGPTSVRAVHDALKVLEHDPQLLLRLATLCASRLEATSSTLVAINREHEAKEGGVLSRIATALHLG